MVNSNSVSKAMSETSHMDWWILMVCFKNKMEKHLGWWIIYRFANISQRTLGIVVTWLGHDHIRLHHTKIHRMLIWSTMVVILYSPKNFHEKYLSCRLFWFNLYNLFQGWQNFKSDTSGCNKTEAHFLEPWKNSANSAHLPISFRQASPPLPDPPALATCTKRPAAHHPRPGGLSGRPWRRPRPAAPVSAASWARWWHSRGCRAQWGGGGDCLGRTWRLLIAEIWDFDSRKFEDEDDDDDDDDDEDDEDDDDDDDDCGGCWLNPP